MVVVEIHNLEKVHPNLGVAADIEKANEEKEGKKGFGQSEDCSDIDGL
jgi:hypothetical protein